MKAFYWSEVEEVAGSGWNAVVFAIYPSEEGEFVDMRAGPFPSEPMARKIALALLTCRRVVEYGRRLPVRDRPLDEIYETARAALRTGPP